MLGDLGDLDLDLDQGLTTVNTQASTQLIRFSLIKLRFFFPNDEVNRILVQVHRRTSLWYSMKSITLGSDSDSDNDSDSDLDSNSNQGQGSKDAVESTIKG